MTRLGDILRSLADKADGAEGRLDALEALLKTKVLWSGEAYMHGDQTVNLSEAVSKQQHGIVLVWSPYSTGYNWNYNFIPKLHAEAKAGKGVFCPIVSSFSSVGGKYVYVSDTDIKGNAGNTGSANPVGSYCLYYVLGV